MHRVLTALVAGASGALATNILHEGLRRVVPSAPRIDLLGMQSMAKMYRGVGSPSPTGKTLYVRTLIGDLISNSAYFAMVGVRSRADAIPIGVALGMVAGIGAVFVPAQVGLDPVPTTRTLGTRLMTIGLYLSGGVVAGSIYRPQDNGA